MLFFEKSDDLHARSNIRDEILSLLTLRFANFNRNQTLRLYGLKDKELSELIKNNNTANKMAGIFDLPDDSARLKDKEIKGEDEYNASLRRKDANIDDDIFDMGFGDST